MSTKTRQEWFWDVLFIVPALAYVLLLTYSVFPNYVFGTIEDVTRFKQGSCAIEVLWENTTDDPLIILKDYKTCASASKGRKVEKRCAVCAVEVVVKGECNGN